MDDRFLVGKPTQYFTKPTLSGAGNEYHPKCGDALQLGSKTGMVHSSCGEMWVAGEIVVIPR